MISLYAFVLQAIYEKLQVSMKTKLKRKPNADGTEQIMNEKERCQLTLELMRQLKIEFQRCDKCLRMYKCRLLYVDTKLDSKEKNIFQFFRFFFVNL